MPNQHGLVADSKTSKTVAHIIRTPIYSRQGVKKTWREDNFAKKLTICVEEPKHRLLFGEIQAGIVIGSSDRGEVEA